jgi:hypothetical protein
MAGARRLPGESGGGTVGKSIGEGTGNVTGKGTRNVTRTRKRTSAAVLVGLVVAGTAGCSGSPAAGGQSRSAQQMPRVLSATQLAQRNAVKITECAADAAEDLELAGTVTNILPKPAGFDLRFDIYDANGVLLKGPAAVFTSPGIARLQPGETGNFTEIAALNGASTVTPVRCLLRGALVERPRPATTRSPPSPVPGLPPPSTPGTAGAHTPSASSAATAGARPLGTSGVATPLARPDIP